MAKFSSFQSLISSLTAAIRRFPLTVLCALVGTFCLQQMTHTGWFSYYRRTSYVYPHLAMCAEIGLCLFLAVALFAESRKLEMTWKTLLNGVVALFLIGYYFTLGEDEDIGMASLTKFSLYILASHLMVAFSPFLVKNQLNGFWQFNKTLFLRFLLSVLYTLVLFGGTCLAMWMLDDLLHVYIGRLYYVYAWYFMTGIFNTLFFLMGVPENIGELESDTTYLKWLKGFSQFILLPLVTAYLIILYAYSLRIIINGNLPKGYVSYLVISFSGLGILALLLIYPLRNNDENKWIKIFSKWFYRALYPLIILLAFSIYNRVRQYGITADRYFIVVLALWLIGIAAYFLSGKRDNIKVIPISLCLIALLSSFGPWGAFSVSARSQKNQLEKILIVDKILVNGKIDTTAKPNFDYDSRRRIESILDYLHHIDEIDVIQPWFNVSLSTFHRTEASYDGMNWYNETSQIMAYMGVQGTYYSATTEAQPAGVTRSFELSTNNDGSTSVKGFDYYSTMRDWYNSSYGKHDDTSSTSTSFSVNGRDFYLVPYKHFQKFAIKTGLVKLGEMDLQPLLKSLDTKLGENGSGNIYSDPDKFKIDVETPVNVFEFRFTYIETTYKDGQYRISRISASVLTKELKVNN